MNAEKFSYYIKNPAHLYQITYSELKSLVLQYPYCQNLRYLLLKKSILEKHPELDQNLQLAATYSNDRNLLYQQIKNGESYLSEADNFVLKEEYIELKDLGSESQPEEVSSSLEFQNQEPEPSLTEDSNTDTKEELPEVLKEEIEEENTEEVLSQVPEEVIEKTESSPIEPKQKPLELLEEIDEEEFDDITPDFSELYEAQLDDIEIVRLQDEKENEPQEKPGESKNDDVLNETPEEEKEEKEDDAISIEDLILLDQLSPMERMEISTPQKKTKEKKQDKKVIKKEPDFEAMDKLIEQTKKETKIPTKENKSKSNSKKTFENWLEKMQPEKTIPPAKETFEPVKSKKVKPKKKKKSKSLSKSIKSDFSIQKKKSKESKSSDKPEVVAQKSLKENIEIASETLAHLLVKQEKYKKAIKMYEKLSLIFPEKSSFFAEQIKKLKNL